jgi:hypothetical protein
MQTVILKNGAEESLPLVNVMMMSLRSLMQENPIAFYELVMKCRDHNHKFFGNVGDVLKRLSLVETSGSIHDSIRNIVLSAAEGDGLDMSLGSPVKK